jgi:hypothetical protein
MENLIFPSDLSIPLANSISQTELNGAVSYIDRDIYMRAFPQMRKFVGLRKLEICYRIPQKYIGAGKQFPELMKMTLSNLQGLSWQVYRSIVIPAWEGFEMAIPKPTAVQIMKRALEIEKVLAYRIHRIN